MIGNKFVCFSIILMICLFGPKTALTQEYYDGYTLFGPASTEIFLIDKDGEVVFSWTSQYRPGESVYLLEDGRLLHTANIGTNATFSGTGGAGGRVEMLDVDSNVTWYYEYSQDRGYLQHHDVAYLPNGNILMPAWDYKSYDDAVAAGRNPNLLPDNELWPDKIIEVKPDADGSGGTIVWEWKVWDHLIQDYDPGKPNYGVVADHPELLDLNYTTTGEKDWNHLNSIYYIEKLDQIIVSCHRFSEIWVIDHSTTTQEAAGHSGGAYGRGGDLLYRWGNPQAYQAGDASDQVLFEHHDATFIEEGFPGAGDFLIFNNQAGAASGREYSSVVQITPPLAEDGSYTMNNGVWGPEGLSWEYTSTPAEDFFALNISGAQRLPNGNTLICEGPDGYFFEVASDGTTVWDYTYPAREYPHVFRAYRYGAEYPGLPWNIARGDDGRGGQGGGCFLDTIH